VKELKEMTQQEKCLLTVSVWIAAFLAIPTAAFGMHIMEGYLPVGYCLAWGAISLPYVVLGVVRLRRLINEERRQLIILAMSGAFIFVISSLKIPSVTGSCSHMTGTGLAAILFGLSSTSVLGLIVLIFQAILLAHGGLTTLGANTFSMAIAGPLVTILLYKAGNSLKLNKLANVFIAVAIGDLFTYCVTSVQLALAYPSAVGGVMASLVKFLTVFAPTQLPLAVVEGLLTVLVVIGLEGFAKRELESTRYAEAK